MTFSDVLKLITGAAGVAGAIAAAAPGGPLAMITAGTTAAISFVSGWHMTKPVYSSSAQKPGQDTEEPK